MTIEYVTYASFWVPKRAPVATEGMNEDIVGTQSRETEHPPSKHRTNVYIETNTFAQIRTQWFREGWVMVEVADWV